jgi:transposase
VGRLRGIIAVERALIMTAWNMLTNGAFYRELGIDYYTLQKSAKAKARAVRRVEQSATPSPPHLRADTA